MKEQVPFVVGQKIVSLEIRTEDDCDVQQHMGYEIHIVTDNNHHLVISGCHDLGPEVERKV